MPGVPYYTDEDAAQNDTLKTAIQTLKEKRIQKILPNVRVFSVNLNFMTGSLPNWIKYHPNFGLWVPFTFIFPQVKDIIIMVKLPDSLVILSLQI